MFRVAAPLIFALGIGGCSLAFVRGPPEDHATLSEFECTDSRTLPIIEGVWTALFLAAGISELVAPTDEWSKVSGPANVGLGVLLGASSYAGFARVSRCRSAIEELRERSTIPPP